MTENQKCSHAFTIRGYAKIMRKKWKGDTRSRGAGGGGLEFPARLKDVVPKYRWWGCKECGRQKRRMILLSDFSDSDFQSDHEIKAEEKEQARPTFNNILINTTNVAVATTATVAVTAAVTNPRAQQNEGTAPLNIMPRRRRGRPRLMRRGLSAQTNNTTVTAVAGNNNTNEIMKLRNGKTIERSSRIIIPRENNTIIPSSSFGMVTKGKGILITEEAGAPNANANVNANDANYQSLRITSHSSSTPIITLGGKAPTPPLHNNNPSATHSIITGKAPILHNNAHFSDEDEDTESDEDIKMRRLELMAGIDDDTLKRRVVYGSYGNHSSSAWQLSLGPNFEPNQLRRNIAPGFPIHSSAGSSSHINTPTALNPRGTQLIFPRPKFFSFPPLPSAVGFNHSFSNNNLTFHPHQQYKEFPTGISNQGQTSTLQPHVVTLFGAPISLNPQQQSTRQMLQLSQLGTTKPPMITDANNTSGVLQKNQGSSQGKKDSQ